MKSIVLFSFICCLFFSSCQQKLFNQDSKNWLGCPKNEVIKKMGNPIKKGNDGAGNEALLFSKAIKEHFHYTIFYFNANNLVTNWRSFEEKLPPEKIDLAIYHQ